MYKYISLVLLCFAIYPISALAWTNEDVHDVLKTNKDFLAILGYGYACLGNYDENAGKKFDSQRLGKEMQSALNISYEEMMLAPMLMMNGIKLAETEKFSRCPMMTAIVANILKKKSKNQAAIKVFEEAAYHYNNEQGSSSGQGNITDKELKEEQIFNIDDIGFTLGYAANCTDVPSETSEKYFDWFVNEFGYTKLEAFGNAFEKGEQSYKKNKGRDCKRHQSKLKELGIQ